MIELRGVEVLIFGFWGFERVVVDWEVGREVLVCKSTWHSEGMKGSLLDLVIDDFHDCCCITAEGGDCEKVCR